MKKLIEHYKNYPKNMNIFGSTYQDGYHSFSLGEDNFEGQRDCYKRLHKLFLFSDLKDKVVLDLGCNIGGMLFTLNKMIKIKKGVGIDTNHGVINLANLLKNKNRIQNLEFYVFNLEEENLDLIKEFVGEPIDIIFNLSISMWIKNWEKVIKWCYENCKDFMLLETNGDENFQKNVIEKSKEFFSNYIYVYENSDDDPIQKMRKLIVFWK